MRNFSSVSTAKFVSYTINYGEYVSDDVDVADVVRELARAFETPTATVFSAWKEACEGCDSSEHVSPSEYHVLVDLFGFCLRVQRALCTDGRDDVSCNFFYANLNTGKNVTWSLVIV